MEDRKFNIRVFTAVGMSISGIGLPVSGLMNHVLGFVPLTLERHLWMSIHWILGFFLTFFALWHVVLNRKPLANYLKKTVLLSSGKEGILAAALVLFILAFGIFHCYLAAGRI